MTMYPFNGVWFAFVCTMAALGLALHLALRHRRPAVQRKALAALAGANIVFSTVFTFDLILDPAVYFPFTQNLPFHFCTLMTFLLVPAVLFDFRPLRALVFFPGALTGFLALISPGTVYQDRPMASLTTLFYVVHSLNAVIPVLIASLGFYRPTAKDGAKSMVYFTILGLAVLPVTVALRAWVDPKANYFYFFDPEGAEILVAFHDVIGLPILYEVPLVLAAVPVVMFQAVLFRGGGVLARQADSVWVRLRGPATP
ncbi:MAG: YwaF family protein [Bifidobacteriaceae bacterium]|jgi:uncharacterized membrane protein YwaF|nr:YwaF family protein [Bifidobacteriaceae bacterium]